MNPSPETPNRLQRLENFLQQDPGNPALLGDTCDAAIAEGRFERALAHIATAERLRLEPDAWTFRRARVYIAHRNLDEARALLGRLQQSSPHPAIAHDLAYVEMLSGDPAAARALVRPWLDPQDQVTPEQLEALQIVWLRATHRLQMLEEGLAWSEREDAGGRLQPRAKGPASLLAIDNGRFEAALDWSDAALRVDPSQVEALAARAYVAMSQQQPAAAVQLLELALRGNPDDGRTWSALGYASLQMQKLPEARARLERAVLLVPDHVGTWHALGWTRLLQRDVVAAHEAFRQALDRDPAFAESHGALGLVLILRGDPAQAEHHLQVASRLDPSNVTGRYARAVLANEAQDPERLLALAQRLLDRPGFFGGKLSDAVDLPSRRH